MSEIMSSPASIQKPLTPKQIKKLEKKNNRKASLKASMASMAPSAAAIPLSAGVICGLKGINKKLNAQNKTDLKNAVDNIMQNKNLLAKGVEFEDCRELPACLKEFMEKCPKFMQKAFEFMHPQISAAKGNNAFFDSIEQKALVNMDKLPLAAFHELGHAYNFNNSALWKNIQKMRTPAMAIASTLALFAAFGKKSKPKEENNGELTKMQKANNFVRKHSGKLAFAAMVPVLAEEGMATLRGNSWAKEFLKPELAKKVLKNNRVAYVSYLLAAVGTGLAAFVAKKVKDNLTEKTAQEDQVFYSYQG